MKHKLYSELRTIYETTKKNPHTFRVTVKMQDIINRDVLRRSIDKTMQRYPYFAQRLVKEGEEFFYEDNSAPLPLAYGDAPSVLNSEETYYHLLAFSYFKNRIHIDVYHALTDGGGIYNLIKTLLYFYCTEYYEEEESEKNIRLPGDEISPAEWDDPADIGENFKTNFVVKKWNKPAFQLRDGGKVNITDRCLCYNIRIPEAEFMRFNLSNDGSPGTIISLLLAGAIESGRDEITDPVVIAMCVNQRRMLGSPLAHQSLVGDVRIVYNERLKKLDFIDRATCFRGMVALQSDKDVVLDEINGYRATIAQTEKFATLNERHKYCVDLMNKVTQCMTATVSYVGKADFGDAEKHIQEFHVMPSTALPSSATPLTLELSAVNGSFYVNFMQYFKEDIYINAFLKELRENNIRYDVLDLTDTKYPEMGDIWGN